MKNFFTLKCLISKWRYLTSVFQCVNGGEGHLKERDESISTQKAEAKMIESKEYIIPKGATIRVPDVGGVVSSFETLHETRVRAVQRFPVFLPEVNLEKSAPAGPEHEG